jgi:hypothetical protein
VSEDEVPGTSFAAREEDDVHRASSATGPLEIPLAIGAVFLGETSIFKGLHMAGILVVRSLEQL